MSLPPPPMPPAEAELFGAVLDAIAAALKVGVSAERALSLAHNAASSFEEELQNAAALSRDTTTR